MPDQISPRFFGRRRGKKLRVTGQKLVEDLLPRLAVALPPQGQILDPACLFGRAVREVWLEIGFGGGEHLAWQAAHNPDIGIVGAEVFLNGIASLLGHVEREGLDNIRIYPEDVRQLLPHFPDGCLSRVFLLFPDPWPKSRHAERRFVSDANLDPLHRLMRPGAEFRIGTDDPTYQEWALSVMGARKDFAPGFTDPRAKPEDWPETRYEAKARREGRAPIFLSYRRI